MGKGLLPAEILITCAKGLLIFTSPQEIWQWHDPLQMVVCKSKTVSDSRPIGEKISCGQATSAASEHVFSDVGLIIEQKELQ